FLFDSHVKNRELINWVKGRGGIVVWDVQDNLNYLVLDESRRASPGKSPVERKAAKLTGAWITTIYENDLPALLLPSREEPLAVLHAEAAGNKRWRQMLPPDESPWKIDLAGADLSGLELISFDLRNCDFDGIKLRDT